MKKSKKTALIIAGLEIAGGAAIILYAHAKEKINQRKRIREHFDDEENKKLDEAIRDSKDEA